MSGAMAGQDFCAASRFSCVVDSSRCSVKAMRYVLLPWLRLQLFCFDEHLLLSITHLKRDPAQEILARLAPLTTPS